MADKCTATAKQTGNRCGNYAIPGGTVCRMILTADRAPSARVPFHPDLITTTEGATP